MESVRKTSCKDSEFLKTGQVIFGGYGPIAQHSFFQLMHQGTQELCADIIAVKDNSLAYVQAITQSKLLSEGADDLKEIELVWRYDWATCTSSTKTNFEAVTTS